MQRLVLTLMIIYAITLARAGHCYSNADCASCVSDARGSACEWCGSSCQMSWDACSAAVSTLASCPDYSYTPPPGEDFFEDVTSLLATNPTQRNYGVAVTDTNGNGKFEFVVAGYGAANQAFEWDGTAYVDVALGSSVLQDASSSAIGVAACDVDGDGAEELYVLNTDQYSGTTSTSDRLVKRDASTGSHIELFGLAENANSANFVAGRSCACVDRTGARRRQHATPRRSPAHPPSLSPHARLAASSPGGRRLGAIADVSRDTRLMSRVARASCLSVRTQATAPTA